MKELLNIAALGDRRGEAPWVVMRVAAISFREPMQDDVDFVVQLDVVLLEARAEPLFAEIEHGFFLKQPHPREPDTGQKQ
ncbi:hypothetical protein [Rhizobium sp. Leaf341]|uniref:hypothetical protein n=1 Tax=Rhizobium sp. Leaf341 TaxID=1736344 RepID=UPI0007162075|nr:hypothetical protein [Rhizobium sp. Leaf341]KQR77561.1 hypothetical protein ASG03_14220 [Rhizobium sp. Leaf341]